MPFLYHPKRLNVATSRARCLAIVVASPELFRVTCWTPAQMKLANAFCRLREVYRAREPSDLTGATFSCTVTWNQRDPILKLPRRSDDLEYPSEETDVRLPDGSVWRFRFAKEFCNVARPIGTDRNRLPDLMRKWFGPGAGHPGTRFQVQFSRSPDGWWVEPFGKVIGLPARGRLVAYPSLRAAAGAAAEARPDEPEAGEVALPFAGNAGDVFAVRAAGDSMNGGKTPIGDGDWLVMRWARGAGLSSLAGRVALVKSPDEHGGFAVSAARGRAWRNEAIAGNLRAWQTRRFGDGA